MFDENAGRQPGAPKIPQTPVELLDLPLERPFLIKHLIPTVLTIIGAATKIGYNKAIRKPTWTGAPYIIPFALVGYGIGVWLRDKKEAHEARHDAMLRHYMSLHPDDFPPFQRTKFKYIFDEWIPFR